MNQLGQEERRLAVTRGIDFLYSTACDIEHFEVYGFDFLSSFHDIYLTQADTLRLRAQSICAELARRWRVAHPTLPGELDADTLTQFLIAANVAENLGLPDSAMKAAICRAASDFQPQDFYWFDPRVEPPPEDVPEDCECGAGNPRGSFSCADCRGPLTMMSRYEVWLVALIRTYFGERFGVTLGARYAEALQWLPSMRPYKRSESESYADFIWSIYAVTHVVYTLNDYGVHRLLPAWLPDEYEFLWTQLPAVIRADDYETSGEMLDALKAFGLTRKDDRIRAAEEFIISRQNADGSWGDPDEADIYERYHPTITAIDGLREHAWHPAAERSQYVMSLLKQTRNLTAECLDFDEEASPNSD